MQRLAQALARSHLIFANPEMWPRMKSLNALLFLASSSVPTPTPAQQEILERLDRLRTRLDQGLLRVAVLGQFKRGKSTLLNALLGAPVLPTGVTPVTSQMQAEIRARKTVLRIAAIMRRKAFHDKLQ